MIGSVSFITDRIAIGDVASRGNREFVATVSVLATERPGIMWDEQRDAPPIGASAQLVIDLADGESRELGVAHDRSGAAHEPHDLEDFLDEIVAFIAKHVALGCVLISCGAGKSRSVTIATIFFCRFAGMSWSEASALIASAIPDAAPADPLRRSAERWLNLTALTAGGPR